MTASSAQNQASDSPAPEQKRQCIIGQTGDREWHCFAHKRNAEDCAAEVDAHGQLLLSNGELRMDAYYYGFRPTGVVEIDRILAAVARAGKAYHHTENWQNPIKGWDTDDGPSYADLIQFMAIEAADSVRLDGSELREATYAVLRHEGYTDEQIADAERTTCETAGCERIDHGWDCTDEDGRSRHPVQDELVRVAETLRVGFEAVGLDV